MTLVVGIDASRNRSGGAKAHLTGVLASSDPTRHGIGQVHIWSYRKLLDALPERTWLIKHNPPELEGPLLREVWWQLFSMPRELRRQRCDILLSPDAGTVGRFEPSVVMSRDMLSYEAGEMRRYGFSAARLRLLLLKHIQARSLRSATGAIFLTKYAAEVIQRVTGALPNIAVIPHGVGENFRQNLPQSVLRSFVSRPVRCLYVSNTEMYKHQWHVVRAVGTLRQRGLNIMLTLAGGGSGAAQGLLDEEIGRTDPQREFTQVIGAVTHDVVPALLAEADIFVFASSCENMPNTLLEAMASGLPIACSDRGPMPEVLDEAGVYFDPENPASIAAAIQRLVVDGDQRVLLAARAKERAQHYSWATCAEATWNFLRANARQ